MIFSLFRKSPALDAAFEAYRAIVAQSRQEKFYADWGVPDTVTGRFDMISLHLSLVLRRLKGEPRAKDFVQALVDLSFRDMDRSLRELRSTVLGVPNKVKKMGNVFYGLMGVLGEALDSGSAANVEAVLTRNVYGGDNSHTSALAAYLIVEAQRLAGQAVETVSHASGAAA